MPGARSGVALISIREGPALRGRALSLPSTIVHPKATGDVGPEGKVTILSPLPHRYSPKPSHPPEIPELPLAAPQSRMRFFKGKQRVKKYLT